MQAGMVLGDASSRYTALFMVSLLLSLGSVVGDFGDCGYFQTGGANWRGTLVFENCNVVTSVVHEALAYPNTNVTFVNCNLQLSAFRIFAANGGHFSLTIINSTMKATGRYMLWVTHPLGTRSNLTNISISVANSHLEAANDRCLVVGNQQVGLDKVHLFARHSTLIANTFSQSGGTAPPSVFALESTNSVSSVANSSIVSQNTSFSSIALRDAYGVAVCGFARQNVGHSDITTVITNVLIEGVDSTFYLSSKEEYRSIAVVAVTAYAFTKNSELNAQNVSLAAQRCNITVQNEDDDDSYIVANMGIVSIVTRRYQDPSTLEAFATTTNVTLALHSSDVQIYTLADPNYRDSGVLSILATSHTSVRGFAKVTLCNSNVHIIGLVRVAEMGATGSNHLTVQDKDKVEFAAVASIVESQQLSHCFGYKSIGQAGSQSTPYIFQNMRLNCKKVGASDGGDVSPRGLIVFNVTDAKSGSDLTESFSTDMIVKRINTSQICSYVPSFLRPLNTAEKARFTPTSTRAISRSLSHEQSHTPSLTNAVVVVGSETANYTAQPQSLTPAPIVPATTPQPPPLTTGAPTNETETWAPADNTNPPSMNETANPNTTATSIPSSPPPTSAPPIRNTRGEFIVHVELTFQSTVEELVKNFPMIRTEIGRLLNISGDRVLLEKAYEGSAMGRMAISSALRSDSVQNALSSETENENSELVAKYGAKAARVINIDCTNACYEPGTSTTRLNDAGTACECTCKGMFTGARCELCPVRYSGEGCNQCAGGLSGYPICGECKAPIRAQDPPILTFTPQCVVVPETRAAIRAAEQSCEAAYCECVGGIAMAKENSFGCHLLSTVTHCQQQLCRGVQRACLQSAYGTTLRSSTIATESCHHELSLLPYHFENERLWCHYNYCSNASALGECNENMLFGSCGEDGGATFSAAEARDSRSIILYAAALVLVCITSMLAA